MADNPYPASRSVQPVTTAAAAPSGRFSPIAVGIGGFLVVWGVAAIMFAAAYPGKLGAPGQKLISFLAVAAVVVHVVGVVLSMGTRGWRRVLGLLANVVPILLIMTLIIGWKAAW